MFVFEKATGLFTVFKKRTHLVVGIDLLQFFYSHHHVLLRVQFIEWLLPGTELFPILQNM
ncbi:MAG: hypothetical protein WA705_21650 [Candidatus Ozemobacteraceae bacterium]